MEDEVSGGDTTQAAPLYIVLDARESFLTSVLRDSYTVACVAFLAWFTQSMPLWRGISAGAALVVGICILASMVRRQRHTFHGAAALKAWAESECARSPAPVTDSQGHS